MQYNMFALKVNSLTATVHQSLEYLTKGAFPSHGPSDTRFWTLISSSVFSQ